MNCEKRWKTIRRRGKTRKERETTNHDHSQDGSHPSAAQFITERVDCGRSSVAVKTLRNPRRDGGQLRKQGGEEERRYHDEEIVGRQPHEGSVPVDFLLPKQVISYVGDVPALWVPDIRKERRESRRRVSTSCSVDFISPLDCFFYSRQAKPPEDVGSVQGRETD